MNTRVGIYEFLIYITKNMYVISDVRTIALSIVKVTLRISTKYCPVFGTHL